MQIEIIKTQYPSDSLNPTREFGIFLKKIHSSIHLLHWYAGDHNIHIILGDLYETLDELFDRLQEEIIGTSLIQNVNFPLFSFNIDLNTDQFKGSPEDILNAYKNISNTIQETLTSLEFNNYTTSVKSGLSNTKEEILSAINKTNYLLSMVNL